MDKDFQPGRLVGEFRIVSRLGKGAMGVVYKARQDSLGRYVALKILNPDLVAESGFVERFDREARLLAQVSHDNIVRAITAGNDKGVYYFVMDYVDGETLSDVLRRGPLPATEVARIGCDICAGLQAAEKAGVVHRDVKPSNIIRSRDGGAKLADLGVAKLISTSSDLTCAGSFVGTPLYAAPEQQRNSASVDVRSDLFALGVTLYQLVTGRRPFDSNDPGTLLQLKESGQFRPLGDADVTVPPALAAAIFRMMAPRPEDRFQAAAEARAALALICDAAEDPTATKATKVAPIRPARSSTANGMMPAATNWRRYGLATVAVLLVSSVLVWRAWPVPQNLDGREVVQLAASAVVDGRVDEARRILRFVSSEASEQSVIADTLTELDRGSLLLVEAQSSRGDISPTPLAIMTGLNLGPEDNYRFAMYPRTICYFYVVQADSAGNATLLFPNENFSSQVNPLRADHLYWLPESSVESRWLHLDELPGEEVVYFVGVTVELKSEQLLAVFNGQSGAASGELERRIAGLVGDAHGCFASDRIKIFEFTHN